MTLEQQVSSIGLSQRLRDLGAKQESSFYWEDDLDSTYLLPKEKAVLDKGEKMEDIYVSAFTVAELLNMAPASTSVLKRTDIETDTIARYYIEIYENPELLT